MEPFSQRVLLQEGKSFIIFRRQLKSYEFNWHIHPEFEIVFILSGHGTRRVGDRTENYTAPEIVFITPGVPHTWVSDKDSLDNDAYVIHFKRDCFGHDWYSCNELKLLAGLMQSEASFLIKNVADAPKYFEDLTSAKGLERVCAFLRLLEFINGQEKSELGVMKLDEHHSKKDKMEEVISYLNTHFRQELSIEKIADELALSTYQLRSLFKRHADKTVLTYLNELRVFEACRLMQNKTYTISYLSELAGFNNLSYFNRTFLKVTGKTPRQYRKIFCH